MLSLAVLMAPLGPNLLGFRPQIEIRGAAETAQTEAFLEVRTVPALPGVEFRLFRPCSLYIPPGRSAAEYCFSGETAAPESWAFKADLDGMARLEGPEPGLYYLYVDPWESSDGTEKAEFSRWDDEVFTAERQVVLASSARLAVGMNLLRQVRLEFQSPSGEDVLPGRVSNVILRSSFGAFLTLEGEGPHWVLAERSLRRDTGLESVPVVYAVQRVTVDGGNVVNRGQLRLVAERSGEPWSLPLLLYSARFEPRDALFGGPVGGTVILELPDGRQRSVATAADNTVEIPHLARGTYRAWVATGPGITLPTIMVLSRDQVVRPPVITYLDLAAVLGGGAGLILGLLLVGRPHLVKRIRWTRPGWGATHREETS